MKLVYDVNFSISPATDALPKLMTVVTELSLPNLWAKVSSSMCQVLVAFAD